MICYSVNVTFNIYYDIFLKFSYAFALVFADNISVF